MVEMKLVIHGIAKHGNILYLVPGYLNGIITVDLETCTTRFISMCEKKHRVGQDLYEGILVSGGLVWCSPCMESQITVYDPSKQKFTHFPLPELNGRGRNLFRCGRLYEIGEEIIVLPQEYPGIIKINKSSFGMKTIAWKEGLYRECKEDFTKRMFGLSKDYETVEEEIWLLDCNYILRYDSRNDSLKYVRVCNEYRVFEGIVKFKDKIILLDRLRAELFEWTQEDHVLKKINADWGYDGMDTENEEGDGCPVGLIRTKNKIIVLLAASKYLYLMDETYGMEKIELDMGDTEQYESKWHYMCYEFDGRNLYLPVCYDNKILIIDTETWEQKTVEIHMGAEDAESIFMNAMTAEKPLTENALFYSLEHFIDKLTNT